MTTFIVHIPGDVLVQRLPDGESALLNLSTAEYHGLDAIGTTMWTALTETGRIDLALDRLLEEFHVAEGTLRHDLDAFVRMLMGKGLLRLSGETRVV